MNCSYITPIHKTVDVILELRTCTRIDAYVSGTLEMREMSRGGGGGLSYETDGDARRLA